MIATMWRTVNLAGGSLVFDYEMRLRIMGEKPDRHERPMQSLSLFLITQ